MTRFTICMAAAILAAHGGPADALDDASWGRVKHVTRVEQAEGAQGEVYAQAPAGKRRIRSSDTTTSSDESTTTPDAGSIAATDADLSADESRSVTQTAWSRGKSRLYLADHNSDATADDDLYVSFTVPNGALSENTEITMTVIGNRLSELVIAFQPGGLVFDTPASLWVKLGPALVDVDTTTLTVWHEYADGTVEETTLLTTHEFTNGSYEFTAEVGGFSRYGLRGSK